MFQSQAIKRDQKSGAENFKQKQDLRSTLVARVRPEHQTCEM